VSDRKGIARSPQGEHIFARNVSTVGSQRDRIIRQKMRAFVAGH
jgi:hypothetical protein